MMVLAEWSEYQLWRPAFAELMDPRFYTIGWLDAEIWSGRARAWCTDEAAIVATLKIYPAGGREVHGVIAAGELNAIRRLIPHAEIWGREQGAIVAGIESRAGWARALRDDGYELHQTTLRKELN
jgi:hypothetical protein